MSWRLLLFSLLCLSTACSHSGLPPPTASRGHLALAMDAYLDDPRSYERRVAQAMNLGYFNPIDPQEDGDALELDREQAAFVFEEVTQRLKGQPGQEDLHHALRDLRAACDANEEKACQFLETENQRPVLVEGEMQHPMVMDREPKAVRQSLFVVVVLKCTIATDGRAQDCQVIEQGTSSFASSVLEQLGTFRYKPWTLAGHPMSQPYGLTYVLIYGGRDDAPLTEEQTLEWARMRVAWTPASVPAWTNLAAQLAVHTPEDPKYPAVLARAYALEPRYWWTATEVAWRRIQVGQHEAALMTLRPALRRSRMGEHPNPYVLETAAAAHFGLNQCTEALAQQRKAVELLPAEWLTPERERFQRKLQDYQSACAPSAPVTR